MSKLFKDALDDAQKLREIAEQNATNKIIEAVAPRIKMLIEQELADEDADGEAADEEAIEFFDEDGDDMPVEAAADDLVSPEAAALPSEVPPIDMAPPVEPVAIPAAPTEFSFEKDGKQVKVSVTVESKDSKVTNIKKMSVSQLLRALNETKSRNVQKAILKELRTIRRKLIIMSEAGDKNSQTKLNALNLLLKENTVMRRRNAGRRLNENAWWLLKEEDEEGGEELDLDMGGDEEAGDEGGDEGGDVDVDAASSALEDLGAALGLDIEVEEEDEAEEGGDEEGGDEDLDLDLEEADHDEKDHDEMYEMDDMDEADHDDMDEEDEMDEMMEISESMLRREIARLSGKRAPQNRRARRSSARLAESRRRRMARRRRLAEMGDPVAAMHGGAEEVIEVTEEDLINALAEELGDSAGAELNVDGSGSAEAAAGHYGGGSVEGAALSERRRARRAQRQLAEARKEAKLLRREAAAAKKELKESNLFNAKLLYVNKLMQSYDLNVKQQRAIVEALDNAQTLREAKLLYTSLTESLKKGRSTKGGTMNESVSRTGSASKSVRSSAPAKNGSELGRWAVLAGLNK